MMKRLLSVLLVCVPAAVSMGQGGAPIGAEPAAAPRQMPDLENPHRPFPLMVGDPAPAPDFRDWVLGDPVNSFERGKVYIIDLWATWCEPCIANMERLTRLQNEHQKDGLVVVGVTSPGQKNTLEAVQSFVFNQKSPVGYSIAWDRARKSHDLWMFPTGRTGLPLMFIVDRDGLIAFIGHPAESDRVLSEVLEGTHDIEAESRRYHDCIRAGWGFTHFEERIREGDYPGAYLIARQIVDGPGRECYAVLGNLAWAMVDSKIPADKRDMSIASRAARLADELTGGKDPETIDTLARVHFVGGVYRRAVELQERALSLARGPSQQARMRATLEEYRAALAAQEREREARAAEDARRAGEAGGGDR